MQFLEQTNTIDTTNKTQFLMSLELTLLGLFKLERRIHLNIQDEDSRLHQAV